MAIKNVQALTFDVFGTVVNWRDGIAREAETLLSPKGYSVDWHRFADRWRARYEPAMDRVRRGERLWAKLDDLHLENLGELLNEFEISGMTTDEALRLTYGWRRLDPWPDSVPGLTRLRQLFILGTLSNGNLALMVNLARYARLPWDVILGAEIAQSYKPLYETYVRSAAALNLDPEQCMMVAAHQDDLLAAQACGFRTAYVHRPLEFGEDQGLDKPSVGSFDIVADSLLDLADKLAC